MDTQHTGTFLHILMSIGLKSHVDTEEKWSVIRRHYAGEKIHNALEVSTINLT